MATHFQTGIDNNSNLTEPFLCLAVTRACRLRLSRPRAQPFAASFPILGTTSTVTDLANFQAALRQLAFRDSSIDLFPPSCCSCPRRCEQMHFQPPSRQIPHHSVSDAWPAVAVAERELLTELKASSFCSQPVRGKKINAAKENDCNNLLSRNFHPVNQRSTMRDCD